MDVYLVAHGTYLPKKILTNRDLEQLVDTSDEWIESRTGMKERRIAAAGEGVASMGAEAAHAALSSAGISPTSIDVIICATMTPDYIGSSAAARIQTLIGAGRSLCFDISAACSGWVYAIELGSALIQAKRCQRVLVVGSEKLSSFVNYEDRSTCVLFGDGSAACLLSAFRKDSDYPWRVIDSMVESDGSCFDQLYIPVGGALEPLTDANIIERRHYIQMKGPELFKQAVARIVQVCEELLAKRELSLDAIDYFVCHQANQRIIDAVAKRLGIESSKVVLTLPKHGNTSAATIGLAFDAIFHRASGETVGKKALFVAFGAGLTWGATLLENVKGHA